MNSRSSLASFRSLLTWLVVHNLQLDSFIINRRESYPFEGLWDHKYFDQNQVETSQEIDQYIFGNT